MILPESISMREALHGHGAKRYWVYVYRDTQGLGVSHTVNSNREDYFEFDWLSGQRFAGYGALREAVAAIDDAALAAEKAKWPKIVSREPDECDNKCRLCKAPPPTEHVHIGLSPNASANDWYVSLCAACQPLLSEGAAAMVARLEAEVARRKAGGAANLAALRGQPESKE